MSLGLDVSIQSEGPKSLKASHGRIPALDGLRGIAVLLVLLGHFGTGGHFDYPNLAGRIFFSVASMGWAGVDLFFVLSGFLITGILYDSKNDPHYFRNFFMRRILRIFPLYFGILVVVFLVLPMLTGNKLGLPANQKWLWLYCSNFYTAFTGGYAGQPNPWNLQFGHFWSLAIEEHFYLVWPFVVYVASRRTLLSVCACLVVGSLCLRAAIAVKGGTPNFMSPCRMDSIAMGAVVSLLLRGSISRVRLFQMGLAAMALGAGVLAALWSNSHWDPTTFWMISVGYSGIGVFCAGALAIILPGVAQWNWLTRAVSQSLLRGLGKYSYGIYVFHGMFLSFVASHLLPSNWLHEMTGRYVVSIFIHALSAILASFLVAWLSWHLYEKRFLQLKRYFEPSSGTPIGFA